MAGTAGATLKLKVGVAGVGRIGKMHVDNILSGGVRGVKVKTVCDLLIESDQEMRAFVTARGPHCKLTTDYRDIINDPEIQAVFIFTSTNMHVEIALAAIAAGKHVFCEKPVDHDIARIEAVQESLRQHPNVYFQVGFNRRIDANFAKVRDVVAGGSVGAPRLVKITSRDPTYSEAYIRSSVLSGGLFPDMTIHDFDMCNYLLSEKPRRPVLVYAVGGSMVSPFFAELGDVSEAVVVIKYDDGTTCTIDNTREAVYGYDQRVEVLCSKGTVESDNVRPTTVRVLTKPATTTDTIPFWFVERYKQAFEDELQFFIEHFKSGKTAEYLRCATVEDMLNAARLSEAASKSLRTGLPVTL
eukprot:TRINITY_DN3975_c0_g2_i2.p1 TRINITY_DN3975_c0_g2~~TRINITY_DN3975_c0_g2_i2.p1  ORF type:complete len:363 (-),score=113.80 TRINITY_DN3975_c0_g2_i2:228-1295(-)